jgi:hypothetical protein
MSAKLRVEAPVTASQVAFATARQRRCIMWIKRRVVAFVSVIAALTISAPVAVAGVAAAAAAPVVTGPSCPDGYAGPTNPVTGCPYYVMSYTVTNPGQPPMRCPAIWSPLGGVPQGVPPYICPAAAGAVNLPR